MLCVRKAERKERNITDYLELSGIGWSYATGNHSGLVINYIDVFCGTCGQYYMEVEYFFDAHTP